MPIGNMWYPKAEARLNAGFDLSIATIKCLILVNDSTTPDDPDHEFVDDVAADEAAATGYLRQSVTNAAWVYDDTDNYAGFMFDPIDFGNVDALGSSEVFQGLTFYVEENDDTDSWLLCTFALPNLAPNATGFVLGPADGGAIRSGIGTLS